MKVQLDKLGERIACAVVSIAVEVTFVFGTAKQVDAANQTLVKAERFSDQGGWVVVP